MARYKCPYCGSMLKMYFNGSSFMVGCSRCMIYVEVPLEELLDEIDSAGLVDNIEGFVARRLYVRYLHGSLKAMVMRERESVNRPVNKFK